MTLAAMSSTVNVPRADQGEIWNGQYGDMYYYIHRYAGAPRRRARSLLHFFCTRSRDLEYSLLQTDYGKMKPSTRVLDETDNAGFMSP